MNIEKASKALFLASNGLFAGAALYISAVEHPARLQLDDATALKQWVPSFLAAAKLQAGLAIVATAAGICAYSQDKSKNQLWLAAAALQGLVVPYTFAVLMPTNNKLLKNENSQEIRPLLHSWGNKHLARTVMSLAALATSYCALFK